MAEVLGAAPRRSDGTSLRRSSAGSDCRSSKASLLSDNFGKLSSSNLLAHVEMKQASHEEVVVATEPLGASDEPLPLSLDMSFSGIDLGAELAASMKAEQAAAGGLATRGTEAARPGSSPARSLPAEPLPSTRSHRLSNVATAVVIFDDDDLDDASPRNPAQGGWAKKWLLNLLSVNKKVAVANKLPQDHEFLDQSTAAVALALQRGVGASLTASLAEERSSVVDAISDVAGAMVASLRNSFVQRSSSAGTDAAGWKVMALDRDVFRSIRQCIGVSEQNFFASLCLQKEAQRSTFAFTESAGKSNACAHVTRARATDPV